MNKEHKKLIELRKEKNISSQNMADKLNISKCYYWQIEHNTRRLSYNLAIKIANIFGLKPDDLFYNDYKNS